MSVYLGDFPTGAVVYHKWETNAADGSSVARGTVGTVRIYRNDSTTQRSSSAGVTDSAEFDSVTGIQALKVDMSDNTDAGFYAAGYEYQAVLVGAVIDGVTVNHVICSWSCQRAGGVLATLLAGVSLTSTERNATADAILGRNVAGGSSTGRLVKEALYFLRNKWAVSAGTLTVYGTDDSTPAWTGTVTNTAGANPITSNDPA